MQPPGARGDGPARPELVAPGKWSFGGTEGPAILQGINVLALNKIK